MASFYRGVKGVRASPASPLPRAVGTRRQSRGPEDQDDLKRRGATCRVAKVARILLAALVPYCDKVGGGLWQFLQRTGGCRWLTYLATRDNW